MKSARKQKDVVPWQIDLDDDVLSNPVDDVCIGVGKDLDSERILNYATDFSVKHICQKQGYEFDKEMLSTRTLIASPEAFKEFPIASILTPGDLSRASENALIEVDISFDSSEKKRDVIDTLTKALEVKGLSQTLSQDVISVADEMFTNAVYNAPFVDLLTQVNPGINRHETKVKYDTGKSARVFMAFDETRLVIGCEDPFGTLNLQRWLCKIRETYVKGPAATMNFGAGGAGLGSYIIFNAGASLYFGVWPGSATLLCCVIPLGMSYRMRIQLPKHLHWIQR